METVCRKPRTATLVLTLEERLRLAMGTLTKFQLFSALTSKDTAYISINGIRCILSGISRESSSGSNFILTVYGPDNRVYRCFARTVD